MQNETPKKNPNELLFELEERFSEAEIKSTLKDILYVFNVDNKDEIADLLVREMNDRKVMNRKEVQQFLTNK